LNKWEHLFIQALSTLPFLGQKLREKLERIGTEVPPFLKEEEKAVAGKLHETPRYVHGKDSPFEVIVPWAWIMRL